MPPLGLLLIDDHPVVLSGLRLLLSGSEHYEVAGEAYSVRTALAVAEELQPDLIVTDLVLGGNDRLALVEDLIAIVPEAQVLVYSSSDESVWGERALRAGARGYVSKGEPLETVATAIDAIVKGGVYANHASAPASTASAFPDISSLSARELHIFALMGSGRSRQSLGLELGLSVKTIGTYRERMKIKLGLDTVRALERFAIDHAADRGETT